ncbi:hypothetical protein BO71DRAFT_456166 [Aspergillus ellipticus CBS 707.79]|uniref:Uncharacterized protein n=1 Tax=Aspergillus ellipticus CBS 707.79 TaxID=1448320 RepID=A0A319DNN4_9EURO|nr:hypothetical protein BO71DRAFT_456166 [Aspergillus ellipticus CBS 707.79]
MKQDTGILVASADPGCGKSVLAKYLIDHQLPKLSATICYFFFKDQDQNTLKQALCALLHQLFIHKPSLIRHVKPEYDGNGPQLVNIQSSLENILENVCRDPEAGSVIFVLDALDECKTSELESFISILRSPLYKEESGFGKVKFLLTSRPYRDIMSAFRGLVDNFPYIHIPGENKSEEISQEVNQVIKYRVSQLVREKGLAGDIRDHLEKRLLQISHRTYLWVYLVFDYLEKQDFWRTKKGIDGPID